MRQIVTGRTLIVSLGILILLTSACGKRRTTAASARPAPARPGTTEVGYASWYGDPYHGRRAANGEIYDKHQMTAAHRTLPFDTLVSVLNLDNQREVRVRINDRGPFIAGRIIDLSQAAAEGIAMIGPGTAKVRLEVLSGGPAPGPDRFAVQIGAFREPDSAEQLQRRMAARYGGAYIEEVRTDQGLLYRVRVGPKPSLTEAQQLAASLERENFSSLIVRVDSTVRN